jgi:hypothetical protein
MIPNWLKSDVEDIFLKNPQVRVVLWHDPKEEFARFLDTHSFPATGSKFELIRYCLDESNDCFHGPLWVKAQIVWETRHLSNTERAEQRFVIHVPFSREDFDQRRDLEPLLEYKFRGRPWLIAGKEPSVFAFLRKHNVKLPVSQKDQRLLWEGGKESLLAKLIAMHGTRDGVFWSQPLDAGKANQLLVGDLDERLFKVIADPDNAASYLLESDLLAEFMDAVKERFGFDHELANDPHGWVNDFTIRLAMAECFEGYNRPADFPFVALVPETNIRDRWIAFWKRWVSDRDHSHLYDKIIRSVESKYSLADWASGRSGRSNAFFHIARTEWLADYAAFMVLSGSRSNLEAYAKENAVRLCGNATRYWATTLSGLPGWGILADLCDLTLATKKAAKEYEGLKEPTEFVKLFAKTWHQVDSGYWRIFRSVRQFEGMEPILKAAGLVYANHLREMNRGFAEQVGKLTSWDYWGSASTTVAMDSVWNKSVHGKTAIIVVDALRYDLGAALKQQINGADVTLEPWITAIPSITPVGMTAMLPLNNDPIAAVVSSGKLELDHASYGDMTSRPNRKKMLTDRVAAEFVELSDLMSVVDAPKSKHLVVFTSEIDNLGHKTGHELSKYLDQMVGDLRLAVEKLHGFGYGTVHVVTDHGFVLLADDGDRVDVPKAQAAIRGDRYLFLGEGAVVDDSMLTLPMSIDDRLRLAFAPGVACFGTPKQYVHGGISLEELVVPHLVSVAAQKSERMKVQCALPSSEITTLSVKVVLIAEPPAAADLFNQPTGRNVAITFLRDGKDVALPKQVAIEPSVAEATQSVTIFLNEDIAFRKGDILTLQVRDTDTQEDLGDHKIATVVRDLGG